VSRESERLDLVDVLIQAGLTVTLIAGGIEVFGKGASFGVVAFGLASSLLILAWRRERSRRVSAGLTTGEVQAERVAELEARVAELETSLGRVVELEERVDFTERVLASHREPQALQGGANQ
jgi:hypothetical protein